jgi:CheY-like chemotaxis protein
MGEKSKILIADDMDTVVKLETILLRRTGSDIIVAKTGTEALKKVQSERPKVVLLDLAMPEMNGDVVCKFIKGNPSLKDTKVIIITARGEKDSEERCKNAGCDHFMTKPIKHTELLKIVDEFLKK